MSAPDPTLLPWWPAPGAAERAWLETATTIADCLALAPFAWDGSGARKLAATARRAEADPADILWLDTIGPAPWTMFVDAIELGALRWGVVARLGRPPDGAPRGVTLVAAGEPRPVAGGHILLTRPRDPLTPDDSGRHAENEAIRSSGYPVLDLADIADLLGLATFRDGRVMGGMALPYSARAAPYVGDRLGLLLSRLNGGAKKVLALDLDDTLWGGTLTEDGIGGLAVGPESALGAAHFGIQRFAKAARERGVMLAVCSRNSEAEARAAFAGLSGMALRPDDIAAWAVGWGPKSGGLKRIAAELNVALDAIVMWDNDPAQRAEIRANAPGVFAPELPADPADWPLVLMACDPFDLAGAPTAEDSARADERKRAAARRADLAVAANPAAYLAALGQRLTITRATPATLPRVAQLTQRANQFHLTGRRPTAPELAGRDVVAAALADIHGDVGIIAAFTLETGEGALIVRDWVMSCRAFGRAIEAALRDWLWAEALSRGLAAVRVEVVDTPRNAVGRDMLAALGARATGDGFWDLPARVGPPPPVELVGERV